MKMLPRTLISKALLAVCFLVASGLAEWQKLDAHSNAGLRGLSVVNERVVWASGTGGTVLRTMDGGKSWSTIVVPNASKLDFRGVRAFDDKTALVMSSGKAEDGLAKIYRTMDGGQHWKLVHEEKTAGVFLDTIAFWDRQHGIVLSDPVIGHFFLLKTDDGGETWKQLPASALPVALPNEGAFAASNSCLVVQGKQNVWFATGGAKLARVFKSTDQGKSWSAAETPMHPTNASSGIFSLAFLNAQKGTAVGGDYQAPNGSKAGNIWRTSDGGKTWQAGTATSPAGLYLSSVIYADHNQIAAGGTPGALELTDGAMWEFISKENVNAIAVSKGGVLWAVGPNGTVLKERLRH